jgi:hypothetical protein
MKRYRDQSGGRQKTKSVDSENVRNGVIVRSTVAEVSRVSRVSYMDAHLQMQSA